MDNRKTPPPFPESGSHNTHQSPTPPPPPGATDKQANNRTVLVQQPQSKPKSGRVWLFVGLSILIAGIITAVVLFFTLRSSDKSYNYSDGQNPEVEHEVSPGDVIPDVETPVESTGSLRGDYFISGTLDSFPFTMEIYVNDDGLVSGTYWNVLYNIRLQVSGTASQNGNLNVTLGSGSSASHLQMHADGGGRYSGIWGKKNKPIVAELEQGTAPSGVHSSAGGMRLLVEGGGIKSHAILTDDYFWYEDQGSSDAHCLEVRPLSDLNYELLNNRGQHVATIFLMQTAYGTSGRMTDISGREFTLVED